MKRMTWMRGAWGEGEHSDPTSAISVRAGQRPTHASHSKEVHLPGAVAGSSGSERLEILEQKFLERRRNRRPVPLARLCAREGRAFAFQAADLVRFFWRVRRLRSEKLQLPRIVFVSDTEQP